MSNQGPFGGRGRQLIPTLPQGEVIANFQTYPEAQQAVDVLARADFPVQKVSVVGNDLKSVERVTGKLSWGRVALGGALSGAWLGIFFGLLLILFSPAIGFGFIAAALLIGAGFGMLFGLVSYAVTRRRRDYTSVMQVLATSYSVIVDPELVNRARNLLGTAQSAPAGYYAQGPAGFSPPAAHPSDPPPAPPVPPADPTGQQDPYPPEPR
jgi:hypothetical protein